MRRRSALLVLALGLWTLAGRAQPSAPDLRPTVILISIDGWRWDYAQKYSAPAISRLLARGISAPLIPGFPSKTFPNHYSIVTGLYPGEHGIVGNTVKDPPTGRRLTMSNTAEVQSPMWWGGEPLWVTAQRAGQIAAAVFWPGSEAPLGGSGVRYWAPYDGTLPGTARVDRVLGWLDLPQAARPTLLMLYFSDVDTAGHAAGPDSDAVGRAVRRVDGHVDRLIRGLSRRHLEDTVNIVIVSDHGMAEGTTDRVVVLDDYVSLQGVDVVDLNPTVGLFPPPGREETIYRALAGAHPRLKVYRREESPEHWHYRNHPRIPPIVGVADEGWQVMRRQTLAALLAGHRRRTSGVHGYDPNVPSMRGIFIGAGPAFRVNTRVSAFENVHLYNALARVLGVTPSPNSGDESVARALLR